MGLTGWFVPSWTVFQKKLTNSSFLNLSIPSFTTKFWTAVAMQLSRVANKRTVPPCSRYKVKPRKDGPGSHSARPIKQSGLSTESADFIFFWFWKRKCSSSLQWVRISEWTNEPHKIFSTVAVPQHGSPNFSWFSSFFIQQFFKSLDCSPWVGDVWV